MDFIWVVAVSVGVTLIVCIIAVILLLEYLFRDVVK